MTKVNTHWDQRVLCSDGNCIGVIGADGRCKECGMIYEGELPAGAGQSESAVDTADDTSVASQVHDIDRRAHESAPEGAEDSWQDRTLCVDEACIGVVGKDGRCKECGKHYGG